MSSVSLHVEAQLFGTHLLQVPRSNGSGGPSRTRSVSTDSTWAAPVARRRSAACCATGCCRQRPGVVGAALRRRPACDEGLACMRQRHLDGPERRGDEPRDLAITVHDQLERRRLHAPDRQHAVVAGLAPSSVNRRLRFIPISQSARDRASAEKYSGSVSATAGLSAPSALRMDASLSADSHSRWIGPR